MLFLATGAAVRLVAPLLEGKHRDPGVVTVDDAGNFAVALCGGHEGGANALAARVADTLGGTPVITTASDSVGFPALDSLGEKLGLRLERGSDLAAVGAALVSGEKVGLVTDATLAARTATRKRRPYGRMGGAPDPNLRPARGDTASCRHLPPTLARRRRRLQQRSGCS